MMVLGLQMNSRYGAVLVQRGVMQAFCVVLRSIPESLELVMAVFDSIIAICLTTSQGQVLVAINTANKDTYYP